MTRFVSTRGHGPVTFAEALLEGLAPDGGLYVPEVIATLAGPPWASEGDGTAAPGGRARPTLADTAVRVLGTLLGDGMAADALGSVTGTALDFDAPLLEVEEGVHLLELFHGPTHAFKDVGARFMARAAAALDPGGRARTVLVATSGDTGAAVAHAFRGLPGWRVVVLFPAEGVSEIQRRQMTTLGGNVTALAVQGTFDDCQRLAKAAFADPELREQAGLTSANSINVARLLPQAAYWVHAARALGWDREATFVVPSGNLGNLCAGLLARRAGMPAAGFVAASNANRVFPDYLTSGDYRPRASVPTLSNAMDVGAPSNLERILWLYDHDHAALARDVRGESVGDADTLATIREVAHRRGVTLDPHTAVAWTAAKCVRDGADGPVVVLATAHPAKFAGAVEDATGRPVELPPGLAAARTRPETVRPLPPREDALRSLLLEDA